MRFSEVVTVLYAIEKSSSRLDITRILAELFERSTEGEAKIIAYLALGELRPAYQGSTAFNLAERSLYEVVARLRAMTVAEVRKAVVDSGDIGDVIAEGRWHIRTHLAVTDVYDALCGIESIAGTGSQEGRIAACQKLCESLDPKSAGIVARIIVGKLRLGFSDMTVIDAVSWMLVGDKSAREVVERAYNICADIGDIVARAKRGGLSLLKYTDVVIGVPIRPAAAERLPSAQEIFAKLGRGCMAQPKIDGFRVQVHVQKGGKSRQVHCFSRNLQNMSSLFPEIEKVLKGCSETDYIAEGEAVAYNEETGEFFPFQETVKRKRKHGISEAAAAYPLRLLLFDILYYQGKSLLDSPYHVRYKALQVLVRQCAIAFAGVVVCIEERAIQSADELEHYFLQMVGQGLEGLVVKRNDAVYQAGKRNFNWIKLKRQEIGHLEDTIDAVVLGYYRGKGRRAKFGIGAFLVGVFDPEQDSYVTIAKIGTGLSDEMWIALKRMCDSLHVAGRPHNIVCAKSLYPDVWIAPELVVEIAADEITRSPIHTAAQDNAGTGLALRFPRIIKIRSDKSASDATTIDEIRSLYTGQR